MYLLRLLGRIATQALSVGGASRQPLMREPNTDSASADSSAYEKSHPEQERPPPIREDRFFFGLDVGPENRGVLIEERARWLRNHPATLPDSCYFDALPVHDQVRIFQEDPQRYFEGLSEATQACLTGYATCERKAGRMDNLPAWLIRVYAERKGRLLV